MLVIHIGQAVSECRGSAAVAFANATITQVERCVQQQLPWDGGSEGAPAGSSASALAAGSSAPSSSKGNDEGDAAPPEQIVVVMDCSGASTLNAARISWVFQSVAATLNKHYPGRWGPTAHHLACHALVLCCAFCAALRCSVPCGNVC
jgi:hypothetical protein